MRKQVARLALPKLDFKSSQRNIDNDLKLSYSFHPDLDDLHSAIAIVEYLQKETQQIVEILKRLAP